MNAGPALKLSRTAKRPPPARPAEADELVLEIEKVVAGGLGLARHAGGVVLVRGALGGERLRARVQAGKGVRHGVITELLEASAERVTAPELPTTDLAHASYPLQLSIKRALVEEALSRIAKLTHPVAPTVASPREWAYRNGAQYLVRPQGLAYHERRGQGVWPVEHDPLVMEAIQRVMNRLDMGQLGAAQGLAFRGSRHSGEVVAALIGAGEPRTYLRAADHLLDAGVVGVSLAQPASQASGRRFTAGVRLVMGDNEVTETLGEAQVSLSASGFSQINPEAAGLAYRSAARLAGSGHLAIDLYGGSGAIGRHLAPHFGKVTVLDSAAEALRRGQADTRASGQQNVVFRRADAATLDVGDLSSADVIVGDPPRAGLSPETRDAVTLSPAKTLVYLSCDPATWARDVGDLVRRGWHLGEVTPHDFYPQTSHVEVISQLTR